MDKHRKSLPNIDRTDIWKYTDDKRVDIDVFPSLFLSIFSADRTRCGNEKVKMTPPE
ncbi:hypothetical protein M5D96_007644 [Drosophila gunungcola]|uniref:Uncharacterized protein n=1 Tax=Drosophila gunungcola TaxID=103775 RepID=A0A9P9YLA0_9MUSC|nr:hypothetical protein M5D96_007644 [Drosophila gunungcola]